MKIKVALRNTFRHRERSLVTMGAIVFGCCALIFTAGFFENQYTILENMFIKSQTGHLQIYRSGYYEKGAGHPFDYLIDDYEAVIDKLNKVDHVKFVSPRVKFGALLSNGESSTPIFVEGVVPKNNEIHLEDGRPLEEGSPTGILIGSGVSKRLKASEGDDWILLCRTVDDSMNGRDISIRGIFSAGLKEFDDYATRLPFETAQQLIRTNGAQILVVMLNDTDQTAIVQQRIEHLIKENGLDLEVKNWVELNEFYRKAKTMWTRWLFVIQLIICLVFILSVYNTMNMAIAERTVEIGTLLAMGEKRNGILNLLLWEGLFLGLFGGIIGAIIGIGVVKIVGVVGIPMPVAPGFTTEWTSHPEIVPSMIFICVGLSVASSIFSTLYPAFRGSKLEIAQALRYTG